MCTYQHKILVSWGKLFSPLPLLEVLHGIEEQLVPEEGETSGEGSLHEAGRQAFEEPTEAFLFAYLYHTVYEAPVMPNLNQSKKDCVKRLHL